MAGVRLEEVKPHVPAGTGVLNPDGTLSSGRNGFREQNRQLILGSLELQRLSGFVLNGTDIQVPRIEGQTIKIRPQNPKPVRHDRLEGLGGQVGREFHPDMERVHLPVAAQAGFVG